MDKSWLRQGQVNILRYLPEFLQSEKEFKATADSCSLEHERIRLLLQDIFSQFFVETATWGLDDWERVLDIKDSSGSHEARRKKILLKLQSNQTSTVEYMTELCRRYFNKDTRLAIEEHNQQYAFKIVADNISYDYKGLIEALETYKPAHLAYFFVHFLDAELYKYLGINLQSFKDITLNTAIEVSFEGCIVNRYKGCVIQIFKECKINMEGVN